MSWYREGTINLTQGSVDVTGVGTAFLSEVRYSDILLVSGKLYEIIRIESDTQLKLASAYEGDTVSGTGYAVIRNLTNASNYDLMKKIDEFLTDRQRSMDEFVEWINGLPSTGPKGDGTFPLTDRYGVTIYAKSPKQMEADTLALTNRQSDLISQTETTLASAQSKLTALGNQEAWANQILGYKDAAAASATKASQWAENGENVAVETGKYSAKHHAIKAAASATAASSSATAAATSKTGADAAKTAAESAKTAAQLSETNAAASATAAKTSETNAAGSASGAATSASQAATSKAGADAAKTAAEAAKTAAQTSETNAAASATSAAGSASAASTSANTAKDWAEKTSGAVTGTQYSAKYHAQLAQTARADVETRQSDIITRQSDVQTRQSDVISRQSNVVSLESSATSSKNAAATSATTATTKATEAANSATAASTSATNASASELKAGKWAEEVENTPVETGKYSAKHHAAKAAASAAAASASKTSADTAKAAAEAAQSAAQIAKTGAQTAEENAVSAKIAAENARDRAELAASTMTGALSEFGAVNLSAGVYPAKPVSAGFWKVTVGGTVEGIDYGVGDTLVYSKNLDQFYKIDNTESVTSVNGRTGVVNLSAADVGALSATGTAVSASKLATARTLSIAGDGSGSVSFDGSANAAITMTLSDSGVVAGNYTKVTVDRKGRVTAGAALTAADIPTLNQSTTGNAATATKLQTPRAINGVNFDGSANITVVDSTKLPLSGGQLSGAISRAFVTGSAGLYFFDNVAGYTVNSSGLTGAIKITLPFSWTNTMIAVRIRGFDYSGSGPWELLVGGYAYSSGATWANTAVSTCGNSTPFNTVRLGHDGANCCIVLGTTTTVWQYPKIVVERVMTSYSSASADWSVGWVVGLLTDDTGIVYSATPTMNAGVSIGGNAATATKLQTPRTINGVNFDGSGNITITAAANGGTSAACSGNAATATKLQTPRTINGVNFDGSANITVEDGSKLPLAGGTITGPTTLIDSVKLQFGSDADLALWHNGTHSYIDQNGTGNLYIRNNVTGGTILFYADNTGGTSQLVAQLGVGTDNAAYLYAGGATKLYTTAAGVSVTGTLTASSNITAYSDVRLKANIEIIPDALAKVLTLRGVTYDRVDCDNERQTGLIAQEVQAVLPEAVRDDGEHLSVAYGNVVGLLVQAIKELNEKVDQLSGELDGLRRAA